MGIEFLVRGASQYENPASYMAFEESGDELAQNVVSLGFDVKDLVARKMLIIDQVQIVKGEIRETGDYDLEGLFVRLGYAIDSIGAKRVVLDSLETLFVGLANMAILRAELSRLFRWLKDKGVTAIITGERGDGTLTRHGLEEYVSDCVILLDNRVNDQFSTRRLRVVKYRGSRHGTDEYPFLIGEPGISVLPITSLGLTHGASTERIATGIPRLDTMLGGQGYLSRQQHPGFGNRGHRQDQPGRRPWWTRPAGAASGACIFPLRSRPASLCATCARSGSISIPGSGKDCCNCMPRGPLYGLEDAPGDHAQGDRRVSSRSVVVMDPVTNLSTGGTITDAKSLLTRLIDYF